LSARTLAIATLTLGLAACQEIGGVGDLSTAKPAVDPVTGEDPGDVKYFPSDEPLRLGMQRFKEGNFGLAEQYFQDAAEKSPKDVSAWLGLAASYDRLSRFDLADRAYGSAIKLAGRTPRLLNNEGYSYMLRGDPKKARALFEEALRRDPDNQTILNNLALLDSSAKYVSHEGE
jgi:Flp pilus assembly protein TadD